MDLKILKSKRSIEILITVVLLVILTLFSLKWNNLPKQIGITLLIIGGFLVVLDLILYTNTVQNDTISNVIRDCVNEGKWYLIYLFGVLGGHFFLGNSQLLLEKGVGIAILVATAIVFYILGRQEKFKIISFWMKLLVLILGFAGGHFFWSQAQFVN